MNGVEPYIVNLISESTTSGNAITNEIEANHYLSCLTRHQEQICTNTEDDDGISADDFDDIIDGCLYPDICRPWQPSAHHTGE